MRTAPRRFRSRRRAATPRWPWMAAGLILLLLIAVQWAEWRVRPVVGAAARAIAVDAASTAVSQAVAAALVQSADGATLFHVEDDGGARVIRVDVGTLAALETAASQEAEAALGRLADERLSVPVGQVAGSVLFSGTGPRIPVHIRLSGHVRTDLTAQVRSAGVNQTVHTFYLDVTAEVLVISPLISQPVQVHTRQPIAYFVFVGDVPRWWGPGMASNPVDPNGDFQ
ncbi:MAG: sporulation protein YunB [Thermoflavifilum sp.]|nr:sporulation protein YunB [Thermoflavifilum sp.]MCL6512821.1 sporulation protein YunB [Alicyclobacillus sp.]